MKMIPDRVVVGVHEYVVRVDDLSTLDLALGGKCGDTDAEQLVIRIRNDMAWAVQRETLWHEVMHAAWHQTSLPETMEGREEEVIRALSPLLVRFVTFAE